MRNRIFTTQYAYQQYRVFAVIQAAVVIALIVAGLANAAERTLIRHLGYHHHGGEWHEYIEARTAEFEKMHPHVKIERILAGQSGQASMEDKFTVMVAGGTPPDIVEMTLTQAGGMAPKGVFMDLRPFFARDKSVKLSDFAPIAINALTWIDGSLWAMPLDIYPVPAWVNLTLFAEAGLPSVKELGVGGWTWDYALEAFRKLTRDTTGDGKPDQWGITDAYGLISRWIALKQAGGGIFDRDVDPTRAILTDPRTLQGFEWVYEMYRQGINAQDYEMPFVQGKTGVCFTGPTWIGHLNESASFSWDVAPPFRGPDNDGSYVSVNSLQMSSFAGEPDMAWEWMKFLAADRRNLEDFVRRTTRVPAFTAMLPIYPRLISKPPAGVGIISDVAMNPKSYHPPAGPTSTTVSNMVLRAFMRDIARDGKGIRPTMEALNIQANAIIEEGRAGR